MNKSPEKRAEELLKKLSLEEKICQLSCQMLYPIREDYEERREYRFGNFRNPGHFMHEQRGKPVSPAEVADEINRDIRRSMECNSLSVPPIEHAEALHGAQCHFAVTIICIFILRIVHCICCFIFCFIFCFVICVFCHNILLFTCSGFILLQE